MLEFPAAFEAITTKQIHAKQRYVCLTTSLVTHLFEVVQM